MFKVGIIGAESSGKSTLARYLHARYGGLLVEEYGRTYMERFNEEHPGEDYTLEDVLAIAHHQVEELERLHAMPAEEQPELVFFDTELIITRVWLEHVYGQCPPWLMEAEHRYPMDVYLLCAPDIPWEDDPVRENPHLRQYLYEWYEREVEKTGVPYYIINHSL